MSHKFNFVTAKEIQDGDVKVVSRHTSAALAVKALFKAQGVTWVLSMVGDGRDPKIGDVLANKNGLHAQRPGI